MDWMTVKIKAGRIIPALATTTASVAALQTIEFVKILKNIDKEHIKNLWLNLAVPSIMQTEPGDVPNIKINDSLTVNVWDRWDIFDIGKNNMTIKDLCDEINKRYNVHVQNIMYKNSFLWQKILDKDQQVFKTKILDLYTINEGNYMDVVLACTLTEAPKTDGNVQEKEEYIKNLPFVRLCNYSDPNPKEEKAPEQPKEKSETLVKL